MMVLWRTGWAGLLVGRVAGRVVGAGWVAKMKAVLARIIRTAMRRRVSMNPPD
jgi:hypothetical protein